MKEWKSLKEEIFYKLESYILSEINYLVFDVAGLYPNIFTLFQIMTVLTLDTIPCELSFSSLFRIKTKLRNALLDNTLNELSLLSIEGSDLVNLKDTFLYRAILKFDDKKARLYLGNKK